jgi:hypothetical protein
VPQRRVVPVAALVLALIAAVAQSSAAASSHSPAAPRTRGYTVYWDQNEEEDSLGEPGAQHGQLIPPWDPNGQLCVAPDHSGRFSVGYNPTLASQHNPGSKKPIKAPPVGEALYDRNG